MHHQYLYIALILFTMIALALLLRPGTTLKTTPFLILYECALLFQLVDRVGAIGLSKLQNLERLASMLWSPNGGKQRIAIWALSRMTGSRFGNPGGGLGERRAHDNRCDLWKRWWTRHKDQLVWNHDLGLYLPAEEMETRTSDEPRN